MDHCVFIQANDKQMLGAIVAEYALRRNSKHNDRFDVRIMHYDDIPVFREHEGQKFLRGGGKRVWVRDDLQSFTPSRFLPPQLMGYQGRAVVIDPDVFALADVWELLSRDMQGKAILCRPKSGNKGRHGCLATSVMLLDCARLTHWKFEEQFHAMFEGKRDYLKWVCLKYEDRDTIGLFENEWNDFDHLDENTKMLHTTKRKHQPWKTGLPIDYRPADTFQLFPPKHWIRRARRSLFGDYGLLGHYGRHPDPKQEAFFFGLVRECLDKGIVTEEQLRREMELNHLRHDALELLERIEPLAA
ncbi:MAG TPA: hypothetical protein ENK05_00425 [Gammaproteobacteria bacterium]|nr:hypothetical protein [Gammaproteobacteria bacterium]